MPSVPGVTVDEGRLADVCTRYGIARLRVFGFVARGTATLDSDIDVLYELTPGRRLGWEIEQLPDELAAVVGQPVDLVPPALGRAVRPAAARGVARCRGCLPWSPTMWCGGARSRRSAG